MKKTKTKFITRITAAAALFAFCANPVCYAAYSYNVSEGANGEIIVGGKTSAEQEKKEGNSMKDDNIQNNTGNFIPQQTENTDKTASIPNPANLISSYDINRIEAPYKKKNQKLLKAEPLKMKYTDPIGGGGLDYWYRKTDSSTIKVELLNGDFVSWTP